MIGEGAVILQRSESFAAVATSYLHRWTFNPEQLRGLSRIAAKDALARWTRAQSVAKVLAQQIADMEGP